MADPDEGDGFERTGFGLADAIGMYDAGIRTIDWAKPTKMLEITPEREVVFFGPDGAETWRCSFDDLSAALRQLLDANGPYPPPNWPVEPKTKRDEPRARKVGER